jgi:hypothetical protein
MSISSEVAFGAMWDGLYETAPPLTSVQWKGHTLFGTATGPLTYNDLKLSYDQCVADSGYPPPTHTMSATVSNAYQKALYQIPDKNPFLAYLKGNKGDPDALEWFQLLADNAQDPSEDEANQGECHMAKEYVTDINELEGLNEPDQVDWSQYEDASAPFKMPPAGKYNLRLPDEFKFRLGNAGQLLILLDPLTIVGGEYDGFKIHYYSVSTKKFSNQNAVQAGDVLRNVGSINQPKTNTEWAQAFKELAGAVTTDVTCEWEAYDKETKQSLKGMTKFPKKDDGAYQPFLEMTDKVDDQGQPVTRRVWANLKPSLRGFAPQKAE